jgi:chromosome segregation ATPase
MIVNMRRVDMEGQELHALEEKVEQVLQYCEQLRQERNALISRNEELDLLLRRREEELSQYREEKEDIRARVTGLIERIDQLGANAEPVESAPEGPELMSTMDA